jgi:hypothetical protein
MSNNENQGHHHASFFFTNFNLVKIPKSISVVLLWDFRTWQNNERHFLK